MKGIILAGGLGTRLYPLTQIASKQLLPVFNKPMIYYPLSVLISAGIKDILIISTPDHINGFQKLLKTGSHLGLKLKYAIQEEPRGIAQALIIGKKFIGKDNICLILGDNIFYGKNFYSRLKKMAALHSGAAIAGCKVSNPERYGVLVLDKKNRISDIIEKPTKSGENS